MKKMMLVLMCAATITSAASMTACSAKTPVTAKVTGAVTESATTESQEMINQTVGMPNPWTDCQTLREAEEKTGFSIAVPDQIDGYTQTTIQTLGKKIIQVFYENNAQPDDEQILIRKGSGSDDISGNFNSYDEKIQVNINNYQVTEQGNDGKIMLATWTDAGYTYSVSTPGLSKDEIENIILNIK